MTACVKWRVCSRPNNLSSVFIVLTIVMAPLMNKSASIVIPTYFDCNKVWFILHPNIYVSYKLSWMIEV